MITKTPRQLPSQSSAALLKPLNLRRLQPTFSDSYPSPLLNAALSAGDLPPQDPKILSSERLRILPPAEKRMVFQD